MENFEEGISLSELFRILLKRIYLVLAITLGIVLLAVGYLAVKPVSFDADMVISIESLKNLANPSVEYSPTINVAQELQFLKNTDTVRSSLSSMDLSSYVRKDGTDYSDIPDSEKGVENILDRLQISESKGINIVRISFADANEQFAKDFLEALIKTYEGVLESASGKFNVKGKDLIETQLKVAESNLSASEESLDSFQSNFDIIQLFANKSMFQRAIPFLQLRIDSINSMANTSALEGFGYERLHEDEAIVALLDTYKQRYSSILFDDITRLLMISNQVWSSDSPANEKALFSYEQISFDEQVLQAKEKVREYIANVVAPPELDAVVAYLTTDIELQVLYAEKEAFLSGLKQVAQLERELSDLRRDVSIYESKVQQAKNSLEAIQKSLEFKVDPISIVQGAEITASKGSNTTLVLAVALLLGLALGVLAALFEFSFGKGIDDSDILANNLDPDTPILGKIPKEKIFLQDHFPELVAKNHPLSEASLQFDHIVGTLLFSEENPKNEVICVTSLGYEEGTAFTVANLGISIAKKGMRVLLIGTEKKKKSLEDVFNMHCSPYGLSPIVLQGKEVDGYCVQPILDMPLLKVITIGDNPQDTPALLHDKRFEEWVTRVSGQFDVVLLDAPSFSSAFDLLAVAQVSKSLVLNLRPGLAQRKDLQDLLKMLSLTKISLRGVVLNEFYGVPSKKEQKRIHNPTQSQNKERILAAIALNEMPVNTPQDPEKDALQDQKPLA